MQTISSYKDVALALRAYRHTTKDGNPNQRGVLIHTEGTWKIENVILKEDTFNSTLEKILSINPSKIPEIDLIYWIENFNSAISLLKLKNKKIKPIEEGMINVQFSSMTRYEWLSNFFITVIYDSTYNMIYPSVENGYVAFKARKTNTANEEVIKFAHIIDSKKVKQLGHSLWARATLDDDNEAIAEMRRLVTLKFQQNPFIASWLKKSQATLEEFTADPFWGSALGTNYEANSNHLGKIIQQVRAALQE